MFIGIDPGTTHSGYAVVDENYNIVKSDKVINEGENSIISLLTDAKSTDIILIESIQSYGMSVGREIFETCFWIGEFRRFAKDRGMGYYLYPRPEYTRAVCGVGKVNDSVLWQSLKLRFGGDRKGEPMHLLKGDSDKRSAFALCAYHLDKLSFQKGK